MVSFNDLSTLNTQLENDMFGAPVNGSAPLVADTSAFFLLPAVSGSVSQTTTQINVWVLDQALGIEQLKLHGGDWYVLSALRAEASLAAGDTSITLPTLTQGDQLSFSSPLYTLVETSSTLLINPGIGAVDKVSVPAGITNLTIDLSPVFPGPGLWAQGTLTLDLSVAQDVSITNWTTGVELALVTAKQGFAAVAAVAPMSMMTSLNPSAMHLAVVVELGNVGAGDAAAIAARADTLYAASTTGADAQGLFFAGQTTTGTTIFAFHGDSHGVVSAGDLTHVATLVGVQAINPSDFAVG